MTYVELGTPCPTQSTASLTTERARALHAAVVAHRDFQLVELRMWTSGDVTSDVLIVDCANDQVPSKNSYRIKNRERLAIVVPPSEAVAPQARALRHDFPLLPHINQTPVGEPLHLCLYLESWTETRRSWTPQRFLKRILWWLAESSMGTIHARDQPVERLYFNFKRQIVFPRGFESSLARKPCRLVVEGVEDEDGLWILRADFGRFSSRHALSIATLVIHVDTLIHGRVEEHPTTLGKLHEQLAAHGMSLIDQLRHGIALMVACNPRLLRADFAMILIDVELRRGPADPPELRETRAFFIESLEKLGEQLGVVARRADGIVRPHLVATPSVDEAWMQVRIMPADVRWIPSRATARRLSGISDSTSEERRALIGVGALGSSLLQLWTRAAWGQWTIIDPDRFEAHNLVRHIARAAHIGERKVAVVRRLMHLIYDDATNMETIASTAVPNEANEKLEIAYTTSSLIVDVSTTLTVPRELSLRDGIARCASTFVTPAGTDAVLMLEDQARELRLRDIEAQYYASLLADDWGRAHLGSRIDQMRVGTGCRDASVVLSLEHIQLFGATLARQIRTLTQDSTDAHLRMWRADANGGIECKIVKLTSAIYVHYGRWTIASYRGLDLKLRCLRSEKLPVETGGVIVGYIDHQSRTVFVVDVLRAPSDSKESADGFIRGKDGLKEAVDDVAARTMKMVRYIGDWHSHPPRAPAMPSRDDHLLSAHLASKLAADGDPALMIIVGDISTTYILSEVF